MFDIANYFFCIEMLTASLVISMPFGKREQFGIRMAGAVIALGIASFLIPNGNVKFCLITLGIGIMQHTCWKLSWKKSLYNALCAYALQHFTYCLVPVSACMKAFFFQIPIGLEDMKPGFGVSAWILHIIVYGFFYLLFFRRKSEPTTDISTGQVTVFSFFVFIAVLILSSFLQQFVVTGEYGLLLICYVYDLLCCVIIICLDAGIYRAAIANSQLNMIQYLWKKRQEQYIIAKNNIKSINQKCHKLKQQIEKIQKSGIPAGLQENLESLKDSIGIYDSVVKTGNEVLDVVLTEKSLYCQSEKIVLACVVDGKSMEFMEPTDIYVTFETLLDDALSEVQKNQETDQRQVAISVCIQCGLLMIQVENYCENAEVPSEETGLQAEGQREYEIKSVEYIVRKYKGTITRHREGALRITRISIPVGGKNSNLK